MNRTAYQNAGFMLLLSAVLHLVAAAMGGGTFLWVLLLATPLVALLGWGLLAARRWVAYVALLCALFGGCLAFALGYEAGGVQRYALFAIAAVDWVAAFILFGLLWRSASRI